MKWTVARKRLARALSYFVSVWAISFSLVSSQGSAFAQQKIKLNFAHLGPTSGPVIQAAFVPMAKELEATGKVEFIFHGAGSAYSNPLKYTELLEQGVIDMAYGAHQFNAGQFPLNLLMVEPFLVNDFVKSSRTFLRLVQTVPELKAEYGKLHIVSLCFSPHEAIHSNAPIRTADDLKGKRVQATHPAMIDVLRNLGASIVVLPPSAQYENLQKGVVDATSSTLQSIAAFKLAEVSKYHLSWKVAVQITYVGMNKEKYDSLPPDIKSIIDKYSTGDAAEALAKTWIIGDDLGIKQVMDSRGEHYIMPDAERAALKQRLQPVIENRVAEATKKNPAARRVHEQIVNALAADAK